MFRENSRKASMKQQVTKEPDNIHEVMYNMVTDNGKTTVQLNPPGDLKTSKVVLMVTVGCLVKGVDLTPHVV